MSGKPVRIVTWREIHKLIEQGQDSGFAELLLL